MESTVAATSVGEHAVRSFLARFRSGFSRNRARNGGGGRLLQVEHKALAEQRVEGALEQADGAETAGDVPDQEAVVEADGGHVVAPDADQTAQPPVGDVQGVGVVGAGEAQAGPGQAPGQVAPPVDAHVPPRATAGAW